MFYVDPLCKHGFVFDRRINKQAVMTCHLFHDGNDRGKLLDFAQLIDMKARWIQKSNAGLWHFDLMTGKRERAIANGAIPVSRQKAVSIWYEMGIYRKVKK